MITLAIITLIVICCVRGYSNKKHREFVDEHSVALKELSRLNQKYKFDVITLNTLTHTYDNGNFFEDISCRDFLIYQMQYIQREVFQSISLASHNKANYDKYTSELKTVSAIGKYDVDIGELNHKKLKEIETEIFRSCILRPAVIFSITVILYYEKMNGIKYNKKMQIFYQDEVRDLIKRVNDRKGSFFNDRKIWDAICRVERGKVSNRMRFAIYERDGNRCCKCGIRENFAVLEIDHIVPISKGGKSEYHNLQTLCHRCNLIKGTDTTNYRRR